VATNQSGIGRGLFEMATLNAIHDRMQRAVAAVGGRIDAIFYCPHGEEANCDCRKPKPGLLEDIARRFNTPLTDVPFIGDGLRDLQAALAAGAQPVLVLTGKGELTRRVGGLPPRTRIYADLAAAAKSIVK
jgi:D-glycero-D-manno-heptose 1,7-bisphosphate phosphatase